MIATGVVMMITVAGAVLAVSVRNIVHAIFGLGVALGGVALAFLLLGSPFLAAMEVLIYIGGITVAMIFAVMLSPLGKQEPREGARRRALAGLVSVLLFIAMTWVVVTSDIGAAPDRTLAESEAAWSVQAIGRALINDFNVAFELLSVVLLLAIVGAITIAARRDEGQDPAIEEESDA